MLSRFFNNRTGRFIAILFLGFASGLPLALTGQSLQAWLTVEKVDIATIGFFSLVGLPYTFKFLWAPLMDRFEVPLLPRRIGWLFCTQILLAVILWVMSLTSPAANTEQFALIAVFIAFLSASQDIVIDAYRTDVLNNQERGAGASLGVLGYRLAMILSGGVTFVWADPLGNNWAWSKIYSIMAAVMFAAAFVSILILPPVSSESKPPQTNAKNDIIGFISVLFCVAIGYQLTTRLITPLVSTAFNLEVAQNKKWADMISLLLGIGLTLPLTWWASQKAKFETLNISLKNYFSMKGASAFLIFIILYKLGDSFAGSLLTPFLLKGVGFASAEIGVINKVIGMWLTIGGALLGGALMIRLGLYRALMLFGVLQLLSNLGFWLVAVTPKGEWGSLMLPAFDIVIASLKEPTSVDYLLLMAIGVENLTGGMGTAAFVAFLMALCNQRFSATQYALLSAFAAVGRVWVGPLAGVLTDTIGWPAFFVFSTVAAIPGLFMLWKMKAQIIELATPKISALADD